MKLTKESVINIFKKIIESSFAATTELEKTENKETEILEQWLDQLIDLITVVEIEDTN